jgi:hypothetical protein
MSLGRRSSRTTTAPPPPGGWSGRATTAPRATGRTVRSHDGSTACQRPDGPVTLRHHRMLRGRWSGRTATRPHATSRTARSDSDRPCAAPQMFLSRDDRPTCHGQAGPPVPPRHGVCPKGDKVGHLRPNPLAVAHAGSLRDSTGSPLPSDGWRSTDSGLRVWPESCYAPPRIRSGRIRVRSQPDRSESERTDCSTLECRRPLAPGTGG